MMGEKARGKMMEAASAFTGDEARKAEGMAEQERDRQRSCPRTQAA
jgi:uncharacterized protein YjbJ (UPF0337 family)